MSTTRIDFEAAISGAFHDEIMDSFSMKTFTRALKEEMEEVFTAHGIETITEDQFDDIVAEAYRLEFYPSIQECRRLTKQRSVFDDVRFRW